ncbi:hypothetical protein J6590_048665 [Homalodisca vitripennis]|nr:hypothetical protein J6590_048665 [Homalodisca vitripennis]
MFHQHVKGSCLAKKRATGRFSDVLLYKSSLNNALVIRLSRRTVVLCWSRWRPHRATGNNKYLQTRKTRVGADSIDRFAKKLGLMGEIVRPLTRPSCSSNSTLFGDVLVLHVKIIRSRSLLCLFSIKGDGDNYCLQLFASAAHEQTRCKYMFSWRDGKWQRVHFNCTCLSRGDKAEWF